jgi:hypothetical protein
LWQPALWHLVLWHPVLWHPVLWHPVLWHPVLWQPVLWHPALWHLVLCHPGLWPSVMWHPVLWHPVLWHPLLWHPVLWHPVLWHTVLWHPVLWHSVLWHPVLWHPVLWHPVLWHLYNHVSTERCVVKFSEMPTAPEGTDNTTFTLCSVSHHDFLEFKCTALLLRSSSYVLCIPPQLYWQPNAFGMCALFCPQGVAFVASRPRALLWETNPRIEVGGHQIFTRAPLNDIWLRTVGKEEGLFTCRAKAYSHASLLDKKWLCCRLSFAFRGLVACVPPQTS